MKRSTRILLGLLAVVAVGYVAVSPYLAVRAMRRAALAGDAPGVAAYVDFPAVEDSLKANMTASVMKSAGEEAGRNPMAGAGALFAMALMGPMIDAVASPEGLTALMQHGTMSRQPGTEVDAKHAAPQVDARMAYRDLNTFVVTLRNTSASDAPLGLVFRRHGITAWKLTSLELPQ